MTEARKTFPEVYKAHEHKDRGGFHFNMALTMRDILENPEVSREHKAIALKSVRGHLRAESLGQKFGFEEVFEGFEPKGWLK